MRVFNTAGAALYARMLAGEQVPVVQLVEVDFDTPVYLATGGSVINWDGHDWQPAGLGVIDAVNDSASEMPSLQFSMPGLNEQQVAVALEPGIEGAAVRVYDALLDPDTGVCADAVLAWAGTLNVPTLQDGPQAELVVTAEHRGMVALRAKPSRYTDDEQRRLYPGDTSLDFDPGTDSAPLVWPAASYFRQ